MLRRDGLPMPGFPLTRRIEVDESQGFSYEKAADNDTTTFTAIPSNQIDTVQVLLVRANKAVTLRLDAQTDAGIELNAGGILAIVDATINASAATNVKVNNPAVTDVAIVEGLVAGT